MKISIVILNYNGLKDTLDCLDSLSKLNKDGLDVEIIVVDNDSKDGSKLALSKLKNINLIINKKNLGYSAGNNRGIDLAVSRKADLVLLLNNDTIVDQDFLIYTKKAIKSFDIISPKIYFAKGYEYHKSRYIKDDLGKVIWYAGANIDWDNILGKHLGVDKVDKRQHDKQKNIESATGACMLIKREVFEKIGNFDEKYFLYLEDMDFSVRAAKAGFKIGYEPSAIIWHKNASSSGGSGSELQDYYITKSRLIFAFKFAKLRTKLALAKNILWSNNKIRRKAFLDFITGRFGEKLRR